MPDERYQAQFPFERFFRQRFQPATPERRFTPPFVPPFGPPGPSGPPTVPPPGQMGGPPSGPPPSFVPTQRDDDFSIRAVDPGAVRPCLYRFVYLWLENGRQFWAWLVFVGPRSVAGWRWTGFNWVYFGTDLENISHFICY